MSDQDGGKTEPGQTESTAQGAPEPGAERKEPAEHAGSFTENQAAHGAHPDESELTPAADDDGSELEADPELTEREGSEAPSTPAPSTPAEDDAGRKGGVFALVAFLIGAVVLAGSGYYLWDAYVGEPTAPSSEAEAPRAPEKAASGPAAPEPAREAEVETQAPPVAMTPQAPKEPPPAAQNAAAPAPEERAAPASAPAEAPRRTEAETPAPAPVAPAEAAKEPPPAAPAHESKAATAPAEAAKSAAEAEGSARALAEMTARLEAAQQSIAKLSQRLEAVENLVAAPKDDARASLAAREASPKNVDVSAARLVVAQSLLAAVRQGDDYTAQLDALQKFGADPARLARLRAGLSAPTAEKLADEFRDLAPKLEQASAPAPAAPSPSGQKARESFWSHVEAVADRLVRIRPAGAPDKDAAAMQIDKIEKDLRSGNLDAALADRQKLAPQAFDLSSAWAASAQARIDAESAAKEELAEAMRNLSKDKN